MKRALMATVVFAFAAAPAFAQTGQPRSATPADQTFLVNTAKAGLAEVEFGKVALENATNEQVKAFAQRMVDDHSKANEELKTLAASKNVVVPSTLDAQDKGMQDKLMALKGEAFDREYMTAMVAGHTKVVESLRAESQSGKDPDVKAWAARTLPTVEDHLKMARETNRAVGTSGKK